MGRSTNRIARLCTLGASLCGAPWLGACAHPQATGQAPTGAYQSPDGTYNTTPPPAKKGIIVPGDPGSGTAGIGAGPGNLGTTTGTAGSRVNPGGGNENK